MDKIKILMVIGSLDYCNGITSYAMNYYQNMNHDLFSIDFAVHYNFDSDYKKQIEQDGNHVYFMGDYSLKSMLGLRKRIDNLLTANAYDIIHCHILNVSYFYFKSAKKHGISCRILHSHASKNSDNPVKNIRNSFLKKLGLKYTTVRFACSKLAGDYLFKEPYEVIRNAIDYNKFLYSREYAREIKEKYRIEDELVLGFIGRFTAQKNIPFLLKVFSGLKQINFKFKAFIIGDGSLRPMIEEYLQNHHLSDEVYLVDSTSEVYTYYSAFDIMLLPSLFEGLPVTGVEAQAAGCSVLCSSAITEELNFSGLCRFLEIEDTEAWTECIRSFSKPENRTPAGFDYDIKTQTEVLEKKYIALVRG